MKISQLTLQAWSFPEQLTTFMICWTVTICYFNIMHHVIQYEKIKSLVKTRLFKSDRRGSNPRSRPWQGRALPTTPLSHVCYPYRTFTILHDFLSFVNCFLSVFKFFHAKRVMGIEPTYPAWKAGVLPLNYTRMFALANKIYINTIFMICQQLF